MDSLQRKGINFDLNTQALKEYYPKGDWHNAYADVRDFFEANGFEHIQGSGYQGVQLLPLFPICYIHLKQKRE